MQYSATIQTFIFVHHSSNSCRSHVLCCFVLHRTYCYSDNILYILSEPLCTCHLTPDLQYLADIRQQIPIMSQRRDDLYTVTSVQEQSS